MIYVSLQSRGSYMYKKYLIGQIAIMKTMLQILMERTVFAWQSN